MLKPVESLGKLKTSESQHPGGAEVVVIRAAEDGSKSRRVDEMMIES